MTPEEIKSLFEKVIAEKAIYKQLSRISEDQIYNWRRGRGRSATIGDMLEVLFEVEAISVFPVPEGAKEAWKSWQNPQSNDWVASPVVNPAIEATNAFVSSMKAEMAAEFLKIYQRAFPPELFAEALSAASYQLGEETEGERKHTIEGGPEGITKSEFIKNEPTPKP